ncbi:MAG: general secretion pathway protein GspB [Steroidobacterales bacterium]
MSFILDALKKAEAERQRQTGPTLLEVRVTQPRRRFPLWILIISGLLAVNVLLLIVFVVRRPALSGASTEQPAVAASAQASANAPAPLPPPAPVAAAAATPGGIAAAAAPAGIAVPTPGAAAPATGAAAMPAEPAMDNPADFEQAVPAAGPAGSGQRSRPEHEEPPSLSDIGGDLPDLRLDLHVYAARPADRYALINMHRVHEGDVLPEGPRVVSIDRDGVELSYHGTEFMLHPQ